jgi:hypothetical protein
MDNIAKLKTVLDTLTARPDGDEPRLHLHGRREQLKSAAD